MIFSLPDAISKSEIENEIDEQLKSLTRPDVLNESSIKQERISTPQPEMPTMIITDTNIVESKREERFSTPLPESELLSPEPTNIRPKRSDRELLPSALKFRRSQALTADVISVPNKPLKRSNAIKMKNKPSRNSLRPNE